MSDNLDGLAKNWQKMKADYAKLKGLEDGRPEDWLREPWNMHHWVDMFKESQDVASYLMGHIWAVYFPLSIGVMVCLALD